MVGVIPASAGSFTISWSGQGADDFEVQCSGDLPDGIAPGEEYLLWVLTPGGSELTRVSDLRLGGSGSGVYPATKVGPGAFQFVTPYFTPIYPDLTATVRYHADTDRQQLVISHGCSGTYIPEFPTVALPIAAVLGLVFFFQHRKKKEE